MGGQFGENNANWQHAGDAEGRNRLKFTSASYILDCN